MIVKVIICGGCHCPGDVISFSCVARAGHSTIWQGSAFQCTGNRISLLHTILNDADSCNGGEIHGQLTSVDTTNNIYTSVLNVTSRVELNNKTVECFYDNGRDIVNIVGYRIELFTGQICVCTQTIYLLKVMNNLVASLAFYIL